MAEVPPAVRREQIQDNLNAPLSYANGVEAQQPNELPTKNYVDTHGGAAGSENSRIANMVETSETTYLVVGSIGFDAADFSGKTIKFVAVAAQTGVNIIGYVQLYNLTTASQVALLTVSGGTPTRYESSALNLPSGMNIYEVRVKSGDAAESLILYGAQLEMR
ncbi:MAG: hypothetical protein GYA36_19785 [Veillonellaceae bacterium]|nr:hypothetical protein [Veillonellaceae bacterium]